MNLLNFIDETARSAGDALAALAQQPFSKAATGLLADPHHALSQTLLALHSVTGRVCFGTVVDCVPFMQCYRVLPESGGHVMRCTPLRSNGAGPIGVADGSTYLPGTSVFYIQHAYDTGTGWILGAVPPFVVDPNSVRSYMLGVGCSCGIRVDEAFAYPLEMGEEGSNGGVGNWSANTPIDSVPIADFVHIAETGMKIHLDAYMAQLSLDAMTGMFLFYWDKLCRVAGYNFQLWTAGSTMESLIDEGEHCWHEGIATYLWEQFGKLDGPGQVFKSVSRQEREDAPWLLPMEPQEEDAQPFARAQSYGGYLGQGFKRLIIAPPPGKSWLKYSEDTKLPGLAEENFTLSGRILTRSATGLVYAKRAIIPVPKRMKSPADKSGDNSENYRPAGHDALGTGPEHKVGSLPVADNVKHPGSARACGTDDMHAWMFNWEAEHQFHYHEQDFSLPEESECDWVEASDIPNYSELKSQHNLSEPAFSTLKVDHRIGEVRIYHRSCAISLMDDGGVVITAGDGCEFRMAGGGNIEVNAPGDIDLNAGRNINMRAGKDITARAHQSIDLSTTKNDVRIKSQGNLDLVAGVAGDSRGVLIESKGQGGFDPEQGQAARHPGISLVATKSTVLAVGSEIYLRTGGPETGTGPITFDAAKGQADIISHSRSYLRFGTYYSDVFGTAENINAMNIYTAAGAIINGPVLLDGGMLVSGHVSVKQGIFAVNGSFMSGAITTPTMIMPAKQESINKANDMFSELENKTNREDPATARQFYASAFTNRLYSQSGPGSDTVLEGLRFSFRTTDDYGTQDWYMYEPRWAQMAKRNGQTPDTWEEAPVRWKRQDTYPYPGDKALTGDTYYVVTTGLVDEDGRAVDRGEAYENAQLTDEAVGSPNSHYPITG